MLRGMPCGLNPLSLDAAFCRNTVRNNRRHNVYPVARTRTAATDLDIFPKNPYSPRNKKLIHPKTAINLNPLSYYQMAYTLISLLPL